MFRSKKANLSYFRFNHIFKRLIKQDGRAGVLPEDISKPAGGPNGLANVESHQQREKRVTDLENQLHKLEAEHEVSVPL